jgi:hypothetical protein
MSDRLAPGCSDNPCMDVEFSGPVVEWRGPSPYYFVRVPVEESEDIKVAAKGLEYWGQVPVVVRIDAVRFTTALFPKDGQYLLPLKDAVRTATGVEVDQVVTVGLDVGRSGGARGRRGGARSPR